MTEAALTARRELRLRKKEERQQRGQRVAEVGSLSEEQKLLISHLIDANRKHFDFLFENFKGYRLQPLVVRARWEDSPLSSPACSPDYSRQYPEAREPAEGIPPTDYFKELPHFADMSTYIIQQVINFAKEIPTFRSLAIDDQISLLKGATMEVGQIQFNSVFNLETNQWECGKIVLSIEDGALTGFQQLFLEPLLKFHITFRKLNLHEAEYVLMQALALFSPDRPGVIEHDHIDEIHEKTALTLKCYIDYHHPLPDSRFLYAKLLSLLAELRTLNEENAKQMIHIQNIMSDAMTPLMKEIFS